MWPQPRQPDPSRYRRCERHAEAHTSAANAADNPEVYASEAADNMENRTAAVNAADTTDMNEAEVFRKLSSNLIEDSSENKSLKKPLQDK